MKYLEVIEGRMLHNRDEVIRYLKEVFRQFDGEETNYEITINENIRVLTDLSIHIKYESDKKVTEESALGLHLISGLREYGMVNYSLWQED